MLLFLAAFIAGLVGGSFSYTFAPVGQTVELDGASLTTFPQLTAVARLSSQRELIAKAGSLGGPLPLTVVISNSTTYSATDLSQTVETYKATDDVFLEEFFAAVYVQDNPDVTSAYGWIAPTFANGTSIVATSIAANGTTIPPGPYFVSSADTLYEAWRLYSDFAGALTEPLIAHAHGTFSEPLAGVRLHIEDIYDIAGVKTSNGNRPLYHLYAAAGEDATPVKRLIEAGASIVGNRKTSHFADGEEATADWVDYDSPFKPRGDGYQDPPSSSSGPGAGAASHPWLDLTLGSDTDGSIRGPSQVGGLYVGIVRRMTW